MNLDTSHLSTVDSRAVDHLTDVEQMHLSSRWFDPESPHPHAGGWFSMSDHLPVGYEIDHHTPERFFVRCPDCEHTKNFPYRPHKSKLICRFCDRLMGCTPLSEVSIQEREVEELELVTDGGTVQGVDASELVEIQRRQADALESIADRLAVQNGLALTQLSTLNSLVAVQWSGNPDSAGTSQLAHRTNEAMLDLVQFVDGNRLGGDLDE